PTTHGSTCSHFCLPLRAMPNWRCSSCAPRRGSPPDWWECPSPSTWRPTCAPSPWPPRRRRRSDGYFSSNGYFSSRVGGIMLTRVWRTAALTGLALMLLAPLAAQGFTMEQALSYPFPDGLTPDGATAVYARGSETNGQGEVADPTSNVQRPQQQVWAVEVAGGEPRMLGTMDCRPEGCEDIQISPDGKQAVWSGGGQLWLAPVSGATPARPLAYIRGNVSQPQWSPDSQAIAFVSNRGTHALIGIYRFGSDTLQWVAPSVFLDRLPRWSADGTQLAFVRVYSGGGFFSGSRQPWAIEVWQAASGQAREIWRSPAGAAGSYPYEGEWEEDAFQFVAGNRILFASQQDGWPHLYSIPAGGGT